MKIRQSPRGFTLIELLVVIAIIAILASAAVPAYQNVMVQARQNNDMGNARQIGIALRSFATDFDGAFPSNANMVGDTNGSNSTAKDANEALRNLVPNYIGQEKVFYLAGSKWCNTVLPDEKTDGANALAAGENNFAYVKGLTDTSPSNYPLLADGFSDQVGTYSKDETARGGIWKGRKAVVLRVDGSAKVETCNNNGQVYGQTGGSTKQNIFAPSDNWNIKTEDILNPTAPAK
jgi:prepilin-type N-terminal cleavage/methylation domain-containing protein